MWPKIKINNSNMCSASKTEVLLRNRKWDLKKKSEVYRPEELDKIVSIFSILY